MMMLVAITLIGVAVMGNSRLEWLMASNSSLQAGAITNAQTALGTAEAKLLNQVCDVPSYPLTNCNSNRLNSSSGGWDVPSDEFYDANTSPPAADPRQIASWSTIGADLGGGKSRYLVIRRACAFPPGSAATSTSPPCGSSTSPTFSDVYDVWAMVVDANTNTTRIVRSSFATVTFVSTGSTATTTPVPGLDIFRRTLNVNGQSASQRIGYVEITN